MKLPFALLVATMLMVGCFLVHCADGANDRRALPIDRDEFTRGITSTTSDLSIKEDLISRAYYSHLADYAYDECTSHWKHHKHDAAWNFLRGLSARMLNSEQSMGAPDDPLWYDAKNCLAEAYVLDPNSVPIMLEYGRFEFNYSLDRELGKKLIEDAARIAPDNPRVHAFLGEVYFTPDTRYTDINRAIQELNAAIKLDPNYAFPHRELWSVYGSLYRLDDCKREQAIADSLIARPAEKTQPGSVDETAQ
jgi:tetratricopeptide (TPR) repeat protein